MEIEKRQIWEDVLPEDYLELGDCGVVKNISDLVVVLKNMSDEDFGVYVYGRQNDFAEWILEAYWDDVLAEKVLRNNNKKKIIVILEKSLNKAEAERYKKIVAPRKNKDILKSIGEIK